MDLNLKFHFFFCLASHFSVLFFKRAYCDCFCTYVFVMVIKSCQYHSKYFWIVDISDFKIADYLIVSIRHGYVLCGEKVVFDTVCVAICIEV